MKVICNKIGYRSDCSVCEHGKLHEPVVGIVVHEDGKRTEHLCHTAEGSGYCYVGSIDRTDVVCKEVGDARD